MLILKQNTTVDILLGPFVDKTDGYTVEDALTLDDTNVRYSLNGSDLYSGDSSTFIGYIDGFYAFTLLNVDNNVTPGVLKIIVQTTEARTIIEEALILPASVYDALFAISQLPVNVTKVNGFSTIDNLTIAQLLGSVAAVLLGKLSGAGSNTPTFRNIQDTLNRVSAVTDEDGNRSVIAINTTGLT